MTRVASFARPRVLAAAVLAFAALAFFAAPASAHRDEPHGAQSAASEMQAPGADGAHAADAADMEMTWPTADELAAHPPRPTTLSGRIIAWLGVWHPAVIHFPIALLLTAAFLEAAAVVRKRPQDAGAVKTLLALAALGAFAAAPLGWASAGLPSAEDDAALTAHRYLGSVLPFLLLAAWRLKGDAASPAWRARSYALTLAIASAAILVQAYFGAEVTHGGEHLAF